MKLSESLKDKIGAAQALVDQAQRAFSALPTEIDFPQPNFDGIRQQLDEPFGIFVCGEFNSGKSSILNALAGENIAEVGILPTTETITTLRTLSIAGVLFVDSPGTNSVIKEHQDLTEKYLQRTDFILFVTSCERPLTESELQFIRQIRDRWGRKLIFVLNKIDLLDQSQQEEVLTFIQTRLQEELGTEPLLFPVSAKTNAGLEDLKRHLESKFTAEQQLTIKLEAPQKSLLAFCQDAQSLLAKAIEAAEKEVRIWDRAFARLDNRQKDAANTFELYFERTRALFNNLQVRLNAFVDEYFNFVNLLRQRILRNDKHVRARLQEVVHECRLEESLQEIVKGAAEALVRFEAQILREAREDLELAVELGEVVKLPELSAQNLDVKLISEDLISSADKGLNRFMALGSAAAATGIGTTLVTTAAMVEISGLVLTLTLAMFSFRSVPRERKKAKAALEESFGGLSEHCVSSMREMIRAQIEGIIQNIEKALKPQKEALETRLQAFDSCRRELNALSDKLHAFGKKLPSKAA